MITYKFCPSGCVFALLILFISFIPAAAQPVAADSPFQVHYAANTMVADTVMNISNTGANGAPQFGPGIGGPVGNLCVNVYAFSPTEQLMACCSCLVTPNGLVSLTVNNDVISNTLTSYIPTSLTITLIATATGKDANGDPSYWGSASSCVNSAAGAGTSWPLAPGGLVAWGTNVHVINGDTSSAAITESAFRPVTLSDSQLLSLNTRCAFIIGNGSGYGICRSCRMGARAGERL